VLTRRARRGSAMAVILLDVARAHGVGDDVCLEGTGLDRATLERPQTEIEDEQELTLVRNIVRALGPSASPGLEAGVRVHATTYGVLGLGLISSDDVRGALDLASRHRELCFTLADLDIELGRWATVTRFDDRRLPPDAQRFLFERDVTIFTRFFAESVGADVRPARITSRLPAPRAEIVDRYGEAFGTRPEFGQEANLIVYAARELARPMPQANRQTAALAERLCQDAATRRCAVSCVSSEVRELLRLADGRRVSQEAVAARLAMSTRCLRQQLSAEGISFRQLAQEVQLERAQAMLGAGATVQETTWRLGYSDAAAFSRAFKQWTGQRPGAYAKRPRHRGARD